MAQDQLRKPQRARRNRRGPLIDCHSHLSHAESQSASLSRACCSPAPQRSTRPFASVKAFNHLNCYRWPIVPTSDPSRSLTLAVLPTENCRSSRRYFDLVVPMNTDKKFSCCCFLICVHLCSSVAHALFAG